MTHPLTPLAAYRQFIVVRLVPLANGKTDKIPLTPTGEATDAHASANWLTWQDAHARATAWGQGHCIGFVLTEADPFWVLDIDECREGTDWSALSKMLVAQLPGAVVEVSQSGRGLHLWMRHPKGIEHRKKNVPLHLELYSSKRFIALGHSHVGEMAEVCAGLPAVAQRLFPPAPVAAAVAEGGPRADWSGPTDDEELLALAMRSQSVASKFGSRATFAQLWEGKRETLDQFYAGDASSADRALAQHLAYWTGCDIPRIERLMRRSGLVRAKWDERPDYLVERTIAGACAVQQEVLQQKKDVALLPTAPVPGGTQPIFCLTAAGLPIDHDRPSFTSPTGKSKASLALIQSAFEQGRLWIGRDEFTGRKFIRVGAFDKVANPGRFYRSNTDLPIVMRELEAGGLTSVKKETVQMAIEITAEANVHDRAIQWAESLAWDGTPRLAMFCARYWGCADTAYTRAAALAIWTMLAGRVLKPGIQAELVPILVGKQGARKSTSIRCLVVDPETFAELDLEKDETDLARQMRGKLVCELPELRGKSRKDNRAMKSFISRAVDEWIPKFVEEAQAVPRRCVVFGTTNEQQFLTDPTGERRYLPLEVGVIDIDALVRDREQLWAEAVALFKHVGHVLYEDAERLAKQVHGHYKVTDETEERAVAWLAEQQGPVRLSELYVAINDGRPFVNVPRLEQLRLGDILRAAGWSKGDAWIDGKNVKCWTRGAA